MNPDAPTLITLLIVLGVAVGIFFLIRGLFTWYWRIDEIVAHQEITNELLQKQNELLKSNNETMKQFVEEFMNK